MKLKILALVMLCCLMFGCGGSQSGGGDKSEAALAKEIGRRRMRA